MSCGFHNRILRMYLSNRQISVEQPGERFFRTYFGGWGLIAYYLLKEMGPGEDVREAALAEREWVRRARKAYLQVGKSVEGFTGGDSNGCY